LNSREKGKKNARKYIRRQKLLKDDCNLIIKCSQRNINPLTALCVANLSVMTEYNPFVMSGFMIAAQTQKGILLILM
jgi:hypothetical protein